MKDDEHVGGRAAHVRGVRGVRGGRGGAALLLHEAGDGVVARALQLLLLDLLLDEVLRVADGGGRAGDGHDAIARARGESTLLGDLDVRAGHLLDLDEAAASWAWKYTTFCKRLLQMLTKLL